MYAYKLTAHPQCSIQLRAKSEKIKTLKMVKLLFSVVIFAIISNGLAEPFCNFKEESGLYECALSLGIVNAENAKDKIIGDHSPTTKRDVDVQRIYSDTQISVHLLTSAFTTFINLEVMEFPRNIVTYMNETNFFDCLKLKKFTLSGSSGLDTINSGTFAACKNLEEINLSSNNMASLQNDAFIELSLLTKLDLSDNVITVLSASVFNPLVELKTLILNKNQMTTLHNLLLARTTKLEFLSIHTNKIKGLSVALVDKVGALTFFDLSANLLEKTERGFFDKITLLRDAYFDGNLCIGKNYTGGNLGTINEDFETCFKNNGATEIIMYSKLVLLIIAIGTKFL